MRHPRVEGVDDLARAVTRARGRPAVIVYTLVEPEWRDAMRALCRRARVHYCDLLGQPIESVRRVSGVAARMTPGARAVLNETYFRRMEAIEFAVKYDDGVGDRGLGEADIVLVGVSRTSKTPLSIYLGYMGYKTANVPVVKDIEPPAELFTTEAAQDRRADDRRAAAGRRSAACASATWAGRTGSTRSCSRSTRSSTRRPRSTGGSAAR